MTVESTVTVPEGVVAPAEPVSEFDAALAVMREQKALTDAAEAGSTPPPAPIGEPPPAAVEPPALPAPEAEDERIARVVQRLTASEREMLTLKQELKAAREQAAKAAEYEKLWENAGADPGAIFKRAKWKPEDVARYAQSGELPHNADVERIRTEVLTPLQKQVSELQAQLQQQHAVSARNTEISNIRAELEAHKAAHPYTFSRFESLDEMADSVFQTVLHAYQTEGKVLKTEEVLATSEPYWKTLAERLNRARSDSSAAPSTTTPSSASKQPAPAAPTKPAPAPSITSLPEDPDDDNPDFTAAVRVLKHFRSQA